MYIKKELSIREGYKIWSEVYDHHFNPLIELEERPLLESIGNVKNKKVLDVGCGTGRISLKLLRKGARIFSIDIIPQMLNKAKEKAKKYGGKYEFKLASVYRIPYKNNEFDVVVCSLLISHLKNLRKAIGEMSRVLKPNGHLIISDQHPTLLAFGLTRTKFFKNGKEYRIKNYYHSLEKIFNLLKENNLRVIELKEPKVTKKIVDITIRSIKKIRKKVPEKEYKRWVGKPAAIIIKAKKVG